MAKHKQRGRGYQQVYTLKSKRKQHEARMANLQALLVPLEASTVKKANETSSLPQSIAILLLPTDSGVVAPKWDVVKVELAKLFEAPEAVDEKRIRKGELGMELVAKALQLTKVYGTREEEEFIKWITGLSQAIIRAIASNPIQALVTTASTGYKASHLPRHLPFDHQRATNNDGAILAQPTPSSSAYGNPSVAIDKKKKKKGDLKREWESLNAQMDSIEAAEVGPSNSRSEKSEKKKKRGRMDDGTQIGKRKKRKLKL